jgi:hypothetical protein
MSEQQNVKTHPDWCDLEHPHIGVDDGVACVSEPVELLTEPKVVASAYLIDTPEGPEVHLDGEMTATFAAFSLHLTRGMWDQIKADIDRLWEQV